MKKLVALVLAAFCCSACSEDSGDCTAEGCIDGVEVRFDTPLTPSDLYVAVRWGENDVRCEFRPLSDTCAGAGVSINGEPGSVYGFRLIGEHPEKVTFSFSDMDGVLVSTTVAPQYVTQQPNGPDCPPTCQNGFVRL